MRRYLTATTAHTALLVVLLLPAVACETTWETYTYVNDTSKVISIYENDVFAFDLQPGEDKGIVVSEDGWGRETHIRVVDSEGAVLIEDQITWKELKEMDFRIVVRNPELSTRVVTGSVQRLSSASRLSTRIDLPPNTGRFINTAGPLRTVRV